MELGREAVGIQKALSKRKQVRAGRVAQLKAVGGLGTCGCCFDDELLPEEELRCNAAEGHGFCIPCVKRAAAEFFGQGLFTLNLSAGHLQSHLVSVRLSFAVWTLLAAKGCYLCGQELDKKRPYDHYKEFKLHLSIH
ncbi:E3 ubiquitin-protein ligase [Durusdinium trenchii]|uniref:E3 ubiquitin-protein ligase n=1 Tax=Durusdinium trenchii TaxID=1381693 RepID=A0ABP0Q475_9DINO